MMHPSHLARDNSRIRYMTQQKRYVTFFRAATQLNCSPHTCMWHHFKGE